MPPAEAVTDHAEAASGHLVVGQQPVDGRAQGVGGVLDDRAPDSRNASARSVVTSPR